MDRFHAETRTALTGNTLVGHAAVFGQLAKLPAHWEQLARTAFDAALASHQLDVRGLVNHDPSKLLARTINRSLRLSADSEGLAFEMDLPDTSYANDLRELVRAGLMTGMSFGFLPGTDAWERAPDGRQLRTHTSVKQLLDVSPVTYPVYDGASVSLRAITIPPRPPNGRSRLIRARAHLLTKGG